MYIRNQMQEMLRESDGGVEHIRRMPMRSLMKGLLRLAVTVLAAIAVVLPWGIRNRYSALLRWFRDLLMQNSRAVRQWALKERWSWDSDEQ
jgi:hypothetical protein